MALAAANEDVESLTQFLRGRRQPALGGNLTPADILRRALLEIQDNEVLRQLSHLLARAIESLLTEGHEPGSTLAERARMALHNAAQLAAELPAESSLASALRKLLGLIERSEGRAALESSTFGLAVWQALVYQQVDASYEGEWFAILWGLDREEVSWTPGFRTLLLTAWQGLLWVPPAPIYLDEGDTLDFYRVERGLLALFGAAAEYPEGPGIVALALTILTDTYPRSPEAWEERFSSRLSQWPLGLQEQVFKKWPTLRLGAKQPLPTLTRNPRLRGLRQSWVSDFVFDLPRAVFSSSVSPDAPDIGRPFHTGLFLRDRSKAWQQGLQARDVARIRHAVEQSLAADVDFASPTVNPGSPADLNFSFSTYFAHVLTAPACLFSLSSCSAAIVPRYWTDNISSLNVIESIGELDDLASRKESAAWHASANKAIEQLSFLGSPNAQNVAAEKVFEEAMLSVWSSFNSLNEGNASLPERTGHFHHLCQTVAHRHILAFPSEKIPFSLSLESYVPEPLSYLQVLSALEPAVRDTAIRQLRSLLSLTWNPLERTYLGAIITLTALKASDFHRALVELQEQTLQRMPLNIEYRVLELHAHAGAGQRDSCAKLFRVLERDPGLKGPAKEAVQLLDDAYGFSGACASKPGNLHEEIIASEAGMLVAGS